ncbi:autoinducer binding domain-containing protein [Tepidamorphus sp. 3E244]|uniref:helix-turn-helix transcriptional regulator n=1 Tax=Tepidamorphus sp. 3E244 TaxID=3385498 RepID=UPI0038FBEFA1
MRHEMIDHSIGGYEVVERFLSELNESQTGYDLFKTLKQICEYYNFTTFAATRFRHREDERLKDRVLLTNWKPEFLEELSAKTSMSLSLVQNVTNTAVPLVVDFRTNEFPSGMDRDFADIYLGHGVEFSIFFPLRSSGGFNGFVAFGGEGDMPAREAIMEIAYICGYVHRGLHLLVDVGHRERPKLTDTHKRIFRLLADGLTSAEIADRCGIARSTANYQIKAAISAIGARTSANAVAKAYSVDVLKDC